MTTSSLSMKPMKSLVSEWLHLTNIAGKNQCFEIDNLCPHNGCIKLTTPDHSLQFTFLRELEENRLFMESYYTDVK